MAGLGSSLDDVSLLRYLAAYCLMMAFGGLLELRYVGEVASKRKQKGMPRLTARQLLAYEGIAVAIGALVATGILSSLCSPPTLTLDRGRAGHNEATFHPQEHRNDRNCPLARTAL